MAVLWDVPVLITSERKDERSACARSLHARSLRRSGPFVEFDCGSHSTPVAPGVVAGTGRRDGSAIQRGFDEASGGTLFLDRIEMMGSTLQQQLFLLLEEGALQRRVETPTGMRRVRMIAGASHALLSAVGTGCFDESLFYRLNVIHLDFTSHHHLKGEPMKVKDLMSAPPQTCHPEADLGTVTMVMWNHDCGFVPVIDASGKVAGVITDRDICIATATRRRLPQEITAAQTMTGPVHACRPDDSINDALATMKEFRVRRVPVVDADGQLQGVVSMNDIVLASQQNRKPSASDIVSTMGSICAHRTVQAVTT